MIAIYKQNVNFLIAPTYCSSVALYLEALNKVVSWKDKDPHKKLCKQDLLAMKLLSHFILISRS